MYVLHSRPLFEVTSLPVQGTMLITGSHSKIIRRFYIAIAIPRMFYGASIWLPPPSPDFRLARGITKRLGNVQRRACLLITGALPSSPTESLNAHSSLLLIRHLVSKICYREVTRLACLPPSRPLFPLIKRASTFVKNHRSPLQELVLLPAVSPYRSILWLSEFLVFYRQVVRYRLVTI